MKKLLDYFIYGVAIVGIAYHMVYARYIVQGPFEHLDTHLAFALTLVFLVGLRKHSRRWPMLVSLLLLSLVSTGYIRVFFEELRIRVGFPTAADTAIGVILLITLLVATTLAVGPSVPVVCLIFIGYVFVGPYLPGFFRTAKISPAEMIADLTTTVQSGIYGATLDVSAYYVFLFIVFGGVMQVTGAPNFINEVGKMAGRLLRGGPAMSAVVGSGLVGMVTGGPAANIVIVGSFTIPLMKRVGYKPVEAAGIECAASNGAQIMPPVLGAVAFVMAAFTGIPYVTIMLASFIPALLYYFSIGTYVQLVAMKRNITPGAILGAGTDVRGMLLALPPFIVPLGVIVVLFLMGFTPMYVAWWAVLITIPFAFLRSGGRISLRQLIHAFTDGASSGANIAVTLASCGIIVEVMTKTGLGVKFPMIVEAWSQGSLPIALLLVAVIALLLGMPVPATPTYILVALAAGPVLVRLGLPLLQAHFFIFYYAVMGMITPPVANAAVVACRIAGAPYFATANEAMKVGFVGFLIPFIIVTSPIFLLQPGGSILSGLLALVAGLLMIICGQVGLIGGYLTATRSTERAAFIICTLLFLVYILALHSYLLLVAGIAIFAWLTWRQVRRRNFLVMSTTEAVKT